jgi:hypothetical protein
MRMRSNQRPKFVAPVVLVARLFMFHGAIVMAHTRSAGSRVVDKGLNDKRRQFKLIGGTAMRKRRIIVIDRYACLHPRWKWPTFGVSTAIILAREIAPSSTEDTSKNFNPACLCDAVN